MLNDLILYLECKSGISGDMTVAALLDLCTDYNFLLDALNSLNLNDEVSFNISKVNKNGITCTDFDVQVLHKHNHDEHHHHEHRHLNDIIKIINETNIDKSAKALAIKIFKIVAEAEAKVHGSSIEKVHFHEVGALDSIIDIVSAAVCINHLGINKVVFSALHEGSGFVNCQHGRLPVPVPATTEIASKYNIPLTITDCPYELVTPTGIAIVAALYTEKKLPLSFTIKKTGYGAGKRNLNHANILRAMLIQDCEDISTEKEQIWVLETNIDDSTGEQLGLTMEELFKAGARDVHYIPTFMKKNRPGWLLRVIANQKDIPTFEEIIFRQTTTIGIRKFTFERSFLKRETISLDLPYGEVKIKLCTFGENKFYYPEYESIKALMSKTGRSFNDITELIKEYVKEI